LQKHVKKTCVKNFLLGKKYLTRSKARVKYLVQIKSSLKESSPS
jgi:hypothetical protein